MFTSGNAAWIRIRWDHDGDHRRPTGIKIFSWLATLWRGCCPGHADAVSRSASWTTFTLGGISGVMLAMVPFDIHVSSTYFTSSLHIHYVLFGGSLMTIFAASTTGSRDDRAHVRREPGQGHFWSTSVLQRDLRPDAHPRLQGMPRRRRDLCVTVRRPEPVISIARFGLGSARWCSSTTS